VALPFLLQWLSAGGRVHASNDLDGLQNGVGVIQATSAAVMEDIEWYVYLLTLDDYSPHALVRSLAGADIPVKLPVAVPRILVENIIWNTAMDWEHIHRCAPPSN